MGSKEASVTKEQTSTRLAAILWFVAAALAAGAVGVRFYLGREVDWGIGAAALFCFAMGASAWFRGRSAPPPR